ncbi:glycosyl hydrolase family 18 protein [Geodermatophilus sp. SYSU D00708]
MCILGLVAVVLGTMLKFPNVFANDTPGPPHVVGAMPVWNLDRGSETIAAHASSLTGASPSLYEVAPTGEIVLRPQPDGTSVPDALDAVRSQGIPIVPIISNTRDGAWDPNLIQELLHDPDLLERHIEAIVTLVRQEDYAGIDIDYENLVSADREVFSDFVTRLADALHLDDKILAVDVFAKESDQGYDERNRAQDYAAIGRAADQVRIMAYDRHWQSSTPGPVAPLNWVRSVVAYAVEEVPPQKVVLGIPTYGYGWAGSEGQLVSWLQTYATSRNLDVPVRWDPASQTPWLTYRDADGAEHIIWFENAYSIALKLGLAQTYELGGVFLWLVGDEDDHLWPLLSSFQDGEDLQEGIR